MGRRRYKQNKKTGRMEGAYGGAGETAPTMGGNIPQLPAAKPAPEKVGLFKRAWNRLTGKGDDTPTGSAQTAAGVETPSRVEARAYIEAGVTDVGEAVRWKRAGVGGEEVRQWRERGFTPEEAASWKEVGDGSCDAALAAEMRSREMSPELVDVIEARAETDGVMAGEEYFENYGSISPENQNTWKAIDREIMSFKEYGGDWEKWARKGFNADEAFEWREIGDPDEAELWSQTGFTPQQAEEQKSRGFTPKESVQWKYAQSKYGWQDAHRWKNAGVDPNEVSLLVQEGVDPAEAGRWVQAGFPDAWGTRGRNMLAWRSKDAHG